MVISAAVIFSNTQWTFWNVFLLFFLWIPLIMLWFFAIFDVFRRHDLSRAGKVLWIIAILVLPWIGTLGYLIVRPREAWDSASGYGYAGYGYGGYMSTGQAGQMAALSRMHQSGKLSDEEYATMSSRLTSPDPVP